MSLGGMIEDGIAVVLIGGFSVFVISKFIKKEPKDVIKDVLEWFKGAFKEEEDE